MNSANRNPLDRILLGALAGAAGTVALQVLAMVSEKYLPESVPLERDDPGEFMVHQAEGLLPRQTRYAVPATAEKAAATAMSFGYGATFGALHALLNPATRHPAGAGLALGVGCWAVGYLGWLPALHLTKPVWREDPVKTGAEIVRHAVYGITTAAAYAALTQHG